MAITLKNPAADIIALLTGQTMNSVLLTSGDNLFATPVYMEAASLVVLVTNSGGNAPEPFVGTTAAALFRSSVQIVVQSEPGVDGFNQGEGLARLILGYLQQVGTTLTGYITALFREGAPTFVGVDPETQRNSWSLNLDVVYQA
jgi:hypothetical protein